MKRIRSSKTIVKLVLTSSLLFGLGAYFPTGVSAKVLEGNIIKSGAGMRLSRPAGGSISTTDTMPPVAPPIRLSRPASNLTASRGNFDLSTFKQDLNGGVKQDGLKLGLAKADDFVSQNKFDLGADRNNRELTLAWERWHKQLSKAIYESWSAIADEPGKSTLKVIVRKDRTISIVLVDSSASPRFNRKLQDVIMSLQGNQGLSFPTKSQRSVVSFEADYIAARNVKPGYSWVKDDYEKIQESY